MVRFLFLLHLLFTLFFFYYFRTDNTYMHTPIQSTLTYVEKYQ